MRNWSVALLISLLIAGCQSAANPSGSAGGPAVTQAGDHQSAFVPAPGPPGIDDDSDFDPPSPVTEAILSPFKAIGDGFAEAFSGPVQMIQNASGDTAVRAVNQMQDKSSPDTRRGGLNRLLEFPYTHRPPYTRVYEGMAKLDEDSTVRAAAIRACNRSRDKSATPIFIKGLADKNELVRLESAKALANLPDPAAASALVALANNADENRDVRIAAVDALKYDRTLEVARVLSRLLSDHDFSVCWQARRSLIYLMHRDFGYDEAAWLGYLVGPEKPLQ